MTQPISPALLNGVAPPNVNVVRLGGRNTPGRAIVRGANSPRIWDKRKGYGSAGATLVYTGTDLSEPVIEIYLWDAQHFADWDDFAKAVLAPPKSRLPEDARALDIVHPYVNRSPWNIRSVIVTDVTGFQQDDEGGTQCEIHLQAYAKPQPVLVKPVASTPGVDNKPPNALTAGQIQANLLRANRGVLMAQIAAERGKG